MKYIPKEISWLDFNERVLQEARDESVSLGDRIRFLAIYSSNLDEFYRVRVATLKRLSQLGKRGRQFIEDDPQAVLAEVKTIVAKQRENFEIIYRQLIHELGERKIFIVTVPMLDQEQSRYIEQYFNSKVRPQIFPIMLEVKRKVPQLLDTALYLAVRLGKTKNPEKVKYSLIEIPTQVLPRFVLLPKKNSGRYVILLDEIIRFGLPLIFSTLKFDDYQSFNVKITRDAELDIDDDISTSYLEKISKSLEKRIQGQPVRLVYDRQMPAAMLDFFAKKLKIMKADTLEPGDRYHNFKDFMDLPEILNLDTAATLREISHKDLKHNSIFRSMKKKDILLYFPYHSFDTIIDWLREASIDPKVTSIKITLYRVARYSSIVNALINAVKNFKQVTVILELQARFDERANIYWANRLGEEGAKVVFGVQGAKVHSKLCLITRREKQGSLVHYASIGTGNFNEDTAKIYTDAYLFTKDRRITKDVQTLFEFFEENYRVAKFAHLIVSPFSARDSIKALIQNEISNAGKNKPAAVWLKINNLADRELAELLYNAAAAGVEVRLLVRGMCILSLTNSPDTTTIKAVRIVDRFLEHARIFVFHNGGDEKLFLSSSDLMPRNLDRRIEVTCPVFDQEIAQTLKKIFELGWQDTVKAGIRVNNTPPLAEKSYAVALRSQTAIGDYLKRLHNRKL